MQARVFLVGASRSGTTLIQRCVAAHPRVRSFPETDFFGKAIGGWSGKLRARLGWVRPSRARHALAALAAALDVEHISLPARRAGLLPLHTLTDLFVHELDAASRPTGASVWLEKTPKHFRYVDIIERTVPDARFIHVVRDGRDVVASLVNRANRYPGQFGRQRDPRYGVRLWNAAVRQAFRCQQRPNHTVLGYEDFVDTPVASLHRLCEFLKLPYDPAMHEMEDTSDLVSSHEAWKDSSAQTIEPQPSRFTELLSEAQQRQVLRGLDRDRYASLFPHRALPDPDDD